MRKSMRPNTNPWGTPCVCEKKGDSALLICIQDYRWVIKDMNHA